MSLPESPRAGLAIARRTNGQPCTDRLASQRHRDAADRTISFACTARENNLKDVSVEIPKRRLTVFTGGSGLGNSCLVFDMLAAESQRLINDTYSAFVQASCRRWRGPRST